MGTIPETLCRPLLYPSEDIPVLGEVEEDCWEAMDKRYGLVGVEFSPNATLR